MPTLTVTSTKNQRQVLRDLEDNAFQLDLNGDTGDTWTTNTLGNRPAVLSLDAHFQKDTVGSRQKYVK